MYCMCWPTCSHSHSYPSTAFRVLVNVALVVAPPEILAQLAALQQAGERRAHVARVSEIPKSAYTKLKWCALLALRSP